MGLIKKEGQFDRSFGGTHRTENANGLTLAEWLIAAGQTNPRQRLQTTFRPAWERGDDPAMYRTEQPT